MIGGKLLTAVGIKLLLTNCCYSDTFGDFIAKRINSN